MAKRKTIEVETIKSWVNNALVQPNPTREAKIALCIMLESVLHDTGNYAGFSWPRLDYELVKSDEFNCDHPDYYNRYYY